MTAQRDRALRRAAAAVPASSCGIESRPGGDGPRRPAAVRRRRTSLQTLPSAACTASPRRCAKVAESIPFMADALGFRRVGESGPHHRFETAAGGPGMVVEFQH
ncbi:hypothetical protein ACTMU2_26850 [Cupriavidus basilensis]